MNRRRKALVGGALVASTLFGGGIGAALLNGSANAQTSSSTTAASSTVAPSRQPPPNFDPTEGGHTANGITEALLTGDTAAKVKAAAPRDRQPGYDVRAVPLLSGADRGHLLPRRLVAHRL